MMQLPPINADGQVSSLFGAKSKKPDTAAWSGAVKNADSGKKPQEQTEAGKAISSSEKKKISEVDKDHDSENILGKRSVPVNIIHIIREVKDTKQNEDALALVSQQGHEDKTKTKLKIPSQAPVTLSGVAVSESSLITNTTIFQQEVTGESGGTHEDVGTSNVMQKNTSAAEGKRATVNIKASVTNQPEKEDITLQEVEAGTDVSAASGMVWNHPSTGAAKNASQSTQAISGQTKALPAPVQAANLTVTTMASLTSRGMIQQSTDTFDSGKARMPQTIRQVDMSATLPIGQLNFALPVPTIQAPNASLEVVSSATNIQGISGVDVNSTSALAATVVAIQQAGQSQTMLRLDPPGLGNISVHLTLNQQGQVNVLFVPDTSTAAQTLQSGLAGLGQSMAQAGLTLGQAQVGGQFGQNAHGNGQDTRRWQSNSTSTKQTTNSGAGSGNSEGVSAYA